MLNRGFELFLKEIIYRWSDVDSDDNDDDHDDEDDNDDINDCNADMNRGTNHCSFEELLRFNRNYFALIGIDSLFKQLINSL